MPPATVEQQGTLAEALAHAQRLLRTDPALAREQATEILSVAPAHAGGHLLLGLALAALGEHLEAVEALRRAVALDRNSSRGWRALGDQLTILGDANGADDAYAQSIRASTTDPAVMEAARALCDGKLAIAERRLRAHLHDHPTDVAAIRMLAEVGARLGRFEDAEKLLARCLQLAPSFHAARHNYAIVLHRQSKAAETLEQLDTLLEAEPDNPSFVFLRAAALARVGEYAEAIAIYQRALQRFPNSARTWLSLGHALKTAGRSADSIAAYARAAEIAPNFGEAYWSLANMKTYRFDAPAVSRMQAQLNSADLSQEDRFHLHYALGKAFEDAGDFAQSFQHYRQGAAIRRTGVSYDADETTGATQRHIDMFSRDFFAARAEQGAPAPDPIFIVGLPRAGSTLIEQMLASHSAIEGTMELPDIIMLAKRIGGGKIRGGLYPEMVAELSADDLRALGEEYLSRTRVQRKTGKPFFIDKMPNNFQHIGLIQLILPNAKIVDVRRHPMANCFSAYKQHFARGQVYSYDLTELGRYYQDYVRLMRHFDDVLPDRVHRLHYEDVIADPEREIRRLLAYCGLPFEPACLSFYANRRPVRTASSEQVRQPIYGEGVDHWRHYEPWLAPLRAALGPAIADRAD